MGVVLLQLISFFTKTHVNFEDFNNYKKSEESYKEFLEKIDSFYFSILDEFMRNIVLIIKSCISYNPDSRLTSCELIPLIYNLEIKTKTTIYEEIESIFINRKKQFYTYNPRQLTPKKEIKSLTFNFISENQYSIYPSHKRILNEPKDNLIINPINDSRIEEELSLQKEFNILLLKEKSNLDRGLKESTEFNVKRNREFVELEEELVQCRKEKENVEEKLKEALNRISSLELTIERKEMENNDIINYIIESSQNQQSFKNPEKIDQNHNCFQHKNLQINNLESINIHSLGNLLAQEGFESCHNDFNKKSKRDSVDDDIYSGLIPE